MDMIKLFNSSGKLAACLGAIMSALASTNVGASITYTLTIGEGEIEQMEVTAPDGTIYSRLSGDDMFSFGETGQPDIPYKVIRFLVPDNATDFSVSISNISDVRTISLDHQLYPVQAEIPINDYSDEKFVYADTDTYGAFSSTYGAEFLEASRLEGKYHIVTVSVCPFMYSGNTGILKYCGAMDVTVDYRIDDAAPLRKQSKKGKGIVDVSTLVVNPPAVSDRQITRSNALLGDPDDISRYYIISEKKLLPALKDLAAWKTQKGYEVVMKAIEDIYADPRYKVGTNGIVDEAASLRQYLRDEYDEIDPFYCLLVGDHKTKMPIRKLSDFKSSEIKYNPNGDKYLPTDNYFSDLSENGWDLFQDANGLYVKAYTETNFTPYIYVGRLLCHTAEEISNYIKKLILYESNPGRGNSDYLNNTTLTVMYDGKGCYKDVLNKMSSVFENVECLTDIKISNPNANGYPTGKQMLNRLNTSGYCSWIGHGEPSTVACSGILDNSYDSTVDWEYIKALTYYKYEKTSIRETNISHWCDDNGIDQLTNYDSPSVVNTLACTTCPFDVYGGDDHAFDIPHTVASSFTVGGEYGGVAYLGNTRSGYFSSSSALEKEFLKQIGINPRIGIAEAMSKYQYSNSRWVKNTHNLIGDPEFEIWLKKPDIMNLSYQNDGTGLNLNGTDVSGSRIVISDGTGKIRCIDNATEDLYNIPYINSGDQMESVGVFKTGFLPMVKLDCYYGEYTDCTRRFVVRDARLGTDVMQSANVITIGENADIKVRAVDSIMCGIELNIEENGKMTVDCDKIIDIKGSKVLSGGQFTANGEKVTLSAGFCVNAGGSLSVNASSDN